MLTGRSKLTETATSQVVAPERKFVAPDWEPPEHLADPQPPAWPQKLAAQVLFLSGGVLLAETLGRRFEFCMENDAVSRPCNARPRFAILCYHRVGRGGVPIYSGLPPAVFEAQMNYLRRHYRVLSLDEVLQEMAEPGNTEPAVAITFDDGYADLFSQAFPILEQYRIPATIFLTVGAIESGEVAWYDRVFVSFQVAQTKLELPLDSWRSVPLGTPEERLHAAMEFISLMRKLPVAEQREACAKLESVVTLPRKNLANRMLTWEQIQRMQRAGIYFGAHTMTHPVVNQLRQDELQWELGESKRILEDRLQRPVQDFAFPFGKSYECGGYQAAACLAFLGYRSAATTVEGLNRPATNPFALRRVSFGEERSLAVFTLRLARLFLFDEGNQDRLGPVPIIEHHTTADDKHVFLPFVRSDNA
jgi:peptidoglycan/xylan/chitin deacetylase (PgdA/CDA1 family)